MNAIIALCGFMGSGKSTVGKNLASKLGYAFVDMDSYIEEKQNMSISMIFEKHGEQHFRDLEHDACKSLIKRKNIVISTGGGTLTFNRNIFIFKEKSKIVLLDISLKLALLRLTGSKNRPLLDGENREQMAAKIYNERVPIYLEACHIKVDAAAPPQIVANRIIQALAEKC